MNAKAFWTHISNPNLPNEFLKGVNFSVFGLGDSAYVFFNKAAEMVDNRL